MSKNPTSKKQANSDETSDSIAAQTAAFLKSGRKIQVIERGVSGVSAAPAGKKHITISSSKKLKS